MNDTAPIVHLAAPPEGLVQKCALCGEVLIDRRNQMVMEGYELRWYEGAVEKGGQGTTSTPGRAQLLPEDRVKERPILFSGPMVQAILAGRKTETRRVMNPQPARFRQHTPDRHPLKHPAPYIDAYCSEPKTPANPRGMSTTWCWWTRDDRQGEEIGRCRFGIPGDHLWVRETWLPDPPIDGSWPGDIEWNGCGRSIAGVPEKYRQPANCLYAATWDGGELVWRPSIHMPRWASRLTLEITDVRVQHLQEISEEDAAADAGLTRLAASGRWAPYKGAQYLGLVYSTPRAGFADLWDSINRKRAPWSSNPFVWAITFRRLGA